eukprot:scaffold149469_cov33-Tisochrysis_lutea.AAC.2
MGVLWIVLWVAAWVVQCVCVSGLHGSQQWLPWCVVRVLRGLARAVSRAYQVGWVVRARALRRQRRDHEQVVLGAGRGAAGARSTTLSLLVY